VLLAQMAHDRSFKTRGFIARVKAIDSENTSSHCIIHLQAVAVKRIPNVQKMMLLKAVKFLTFIKSRALNSVIFTALCDAMDSSYTPLLLHTEVRWLTRSMVLVEKFSYSVSVIRSSYNYVCVALGGSRG
jgi:hypothetical protein